MDDSGLDELLRHARFARGLAFELVADEQLAEDAVQETWLAALVRPPRTASLAWVRSVTRNIALKLRRGESRRGRREAAAAVPETSAAPAPPQAAMLRELVDAVLALDEPYRATVICRFYEALPPREIAVRHGVTVSTVNSRLQRALAELRIRLDARRGGDRRAWAGALALLVGRRKVAVPAGIGTGVVMGASAKTVGSVAVLALLAAGTAWWVLESIAGDREAPGETSAAAAPAAPVATAVVPQPVRKRSRAEEPNPTSSRRPAAPAETAVHVPHLAGRVVAADDGSPLPGATVYAAGQTGAKRAILARTETAADGSWSLDLGPSFPVSVVVGAFGPGFRRAAAEARPEAARTERVELRLERGRAIAGSVVDLDGVPVAGLELLAVELTDPPAVMTRSQLDVDRRMADDLGAKFQHARAVTDTAGRFRLGGLAEERYAVLSLAAAWILEPAHATAPTENLRVVAAPALSATLRVRDAATGKPVADCSGAVLFQVRMKSWNSTMSRHLVVEDGETWIQWDPRRAFPERDAEDDPQGGAPEFRSFVMLSAPGYHRREVPLDPGPARVAVLDVELDPVADAALGRLRLEVVDSLGRLVDFPIRATLHGEGRDSPSPSVQRLTRETAGKFVLATTPGNWTLLVSPEHAMGVTDARFQVEVAGGREDALRVQLPPTGQLVVRRPEKLQLPRITIQIATEGESCSMQSDDRELRYAAGPGAFTVVVGEGASAKTHEVTVKAGEESVVELDE